MKSYVINMTTKLVEHEDDSWELANQWVQNSSCYHNGTEFLIVKGAAARKKICGY